MHELRFRCRDIEQRLSGLRNGKEAHEVDRMLSLQRGADFRIGLKPADPGSVPGARSMMM
jgi:hypothetical protein